MLPSHALASGAVASCRDSAQSGGMTDPTGNAAQDGAIFTRAEWYERSINWAARLKREIPVLVDVFGPPGTGGVLDAGCGTGHQACALAERGYRVVGADASEEMLEIGRCTSDSTGVDVEFVSVMYSDLHSVVGGGFDGVYCLGNALAAAASRDEVSTALTQFGKCLRTGGRLFVQVLNFPPMRDESPCVRGPREAVVDGRKYISVRHFHFSDDAVEVTNVTLFEDSGWQCRAHGGTLYPVTLDELRAWCGSSGLRIDAVWSSYGKEPFEPDGSTDLLIVATKQ